MRILIAVLFICIVPLTAMACYCDPITKEGGAASYAEADVVVDGTIMNASDGFSTLGPVVKIKVNKIYKGHDVPDEISANVNTILVACGNQFEQGKDYIIALYDTRAVAMRENNTRGYGFRVMVSCHQNQVREYIKSLGLDNNE